MFCINNFKIFNDYKENQAIFSMKSYKIQQNPLKIDAYMTYLP